MPLKGYVGPPPEGIPNAQPTVENLLRHHAAYGLDNRNDTYRGKVNRYTTYKALSKDSLVEVARAYLSEDAFVFLLDGIGYGGFEAAARADWAKSREDA